MHSCKYTCWLLNSSQILVLAIHRGTGDTLVFLVDTLAGFVEAYEGDLSVLDLSRYVPYRTNALHPWYRAKIRAATTAESSRVLSAARCRQSAPEWLSGRQVMHATTFNRLNA